MLKVTLSRLLAVALRMYLTLHILLFAQTMSVLNPGFHPQAGHPDVTGIPQVNYSTSQQQLPSMPAEVSYLTKSPITTKPVVHTN